MAPRHRGDIVIAATEIRDLADRIRELESDATWLLETLVNLDTPSRSKGLVDRAMPVVADVCARLGARVATVAQSDVGDHLRADWGDPNERDRRTLILAHLDTVWPEGEAARRPFAEEDGAWTGPGVLDMKAGLVQALVAIEARIQASEGHPVVTLLVTSDEEIGSPTSKGLIEATAREASAVLVAEPAAGTSLKTARAGVGMFHLTTRGRASHAGLAPAEGRSAIVEMARRILDLTALGRPEAGTTLNVGTVVGGSARNVVPATCSAELDVRVRTAAEATRVERALRAMTTVDPDVRLDVEGGINRPPMERSAATGRLYDVARIAAEVLAEPLGEASVGGGSDGNFTAAAGVPTLDGLGAVGEGAHALHERVERARFVPRATLVAALLAWRGRADPD